MACCGRVRRVDKADDGAFLWQFKLQREGNCLEPSAGYHDNVAVRLNPPFGLGNKAGTGAIL